MNLILLVLDFDPCITITTSPMEVLSENAAVAAEGRDSVIPSASYQMNQHDMSDKEMQKSLADLNLTSHYRYVLVN